MKWILLLKNDPAEIGRMLAQEQAKREQQRREVEQGAQEYAPHFDELRRLIEEKRAEADRLEAQLREEEARRGAV